MYSIIFVDDEERPRLEFKRKAKERFEVEVIPPLEDVNKLIDLIWRKDPDGIVIDYMLSEELLDDGTLATYKGSDVVEEIRKYVPDFPLFILTSHESSAFDDTYDVNIIYTKEEHNTNHEDLNNRIEKQISHFKEKQSRLRQRLEELNAIPREELTIQQEEEMIEIDSYFECFSLTSIPENLKKTSNLEKIDNLINQTTEILAQIEDGGASTGDRA